MLYSQSPPLAKDDADLEDLSQEFAREPQFGRRPAPAPIHSAPRRPSLGRRMFRAVSRFVIAVAIGVGATLGWQAYGDVAKQMLAERAPEHAWLLSYLPSTNSPAAAVAAMPQAAAPAAASAGPAVDLEPLASNLDRMRRSVEQLALSQEQMARSIAVLHAADEEIRQKISSPPAAAAQPVAAAPSPKPAPARHQAPAASASRTSSAPGPLTIAPSR